MYWNQLVISFFNLMWPNSKNSFLWLELSLLFDKKDRAIGISQFPALRCYQILIHVFDFAYFQSVSFLIKQQLWSSKLPLFVEFIRGI